MAGSLPSSSSNFHLNWAIGAWHGWRLGSAPLQTGDTGDSWLIRRETCLQVTRGTLKWHWMKCNEMQEHTEADFLNMDVWRGRKAPPSYRQSGQTRVFMHRHIVNLICRHWDLTSRNTVLLKHLVSLSSAFLGQCGRVFFGGEGVSLQICVSLRMQACLSLWGRVCPEAGVSLLICLYLLPSY